MSQPSNPQFKLVVPITGYTIRKSADGTEKYVLTGMASNTNIDLTGERMAKSAIVAMERSLETGAVTINNEHSSDWDADFGEVTKLWSTDNAELMMEAELDPDHYRTKTLIKALNKGKKLGLSIGGSVKDAAMEFVEELGRKVLTYKDIALFHVAITGTPAVADTWVAPITKSMKDWKEPSMPITKSETETPTEDVTETPDVETAIPEAGAEESVEAPVESEPTAEAAAPETDEAPAEAVETPADSAVEAEPAPESDTSTPSDTTQAEEPAEVITDPEIVATPAEAEAPAQAEEAPASAESTPEPAEDSTSEVETAPAEPVKDDGVEKALHATQEELATIKKSLADAEGQVAALTKSLADRDAELKDAADALEEKTGELETTVTELEARDSELAAAVKELETIKSRKVIAFDKFAPSVPEKPKTEAEEVAIEAQKKFASFLTT